MRIPVTLALSAILVGVACSQDGPTDVQRTAPKPTLVGNPSFAVGGGGNKPASGYETNHFGFDVVSGNQALVEVLCSTAKRALGVGFKVGGGVQVGDADVAIYESTPRVTSGTDGWRIEAANRSSITRFIEAWVICAPM
jgi:hypothetical protein